MAPNTSFDNATTSSSSDLSFPAGRHIRSYSDIQRFDSGVQHDLLSLALVDLRAHYDAITSQVQDAKAYHTTTDSPILEACRLSLESHFPMVIAQAQTLIESFSCDYKKNDSDKDDSSSSNSSILPNKWQASCMILRAVKYLDAIESAIKNPPRDNIDCELLKILSCKEMQLVRQEIGQDTLALRISSYIPTKLAFDVPIGRSVSASLAASETGLPVNITVEPVVEIAASNVGSANIIKSLKACRIEILKIQHTPCKLSSATAVGECLVRMRISPINTTATGKNETVWGKEPEVKELCIKEARALQVNAYPPKPKVNVDLYKSYEYGNPGCTVTLLVKTGASFQDAIPNVNVEVFLALFQ